MYTLYTYLYIILFLYNFPDFCYIVLPDAAIESLVNVLTFIIAKTCLFHALIKYNENDDDDNNDSKDDHNINMKKKLIYNIYIYKSAI